MGGAVSAGANNDELIDNLLEADYINSFEVERVFRAVDRGHYFTDEYKERAYRDLAWKCGNIHISAPCIYSRVMEYLELGPGMSFLNLGSGTGYLSTMAGLLLGSYGINHGIEIHKDVLNYSTSKLDEFILTSSAIDEYEFCEPKFVNGNCLCLGTCVRQYDRVYCGAACPENLESYMKNLIKVGGILVMPINDQLLQISRTSDTNWESKAVLPVSFASLISGKTSDSTEPLRMPDADPLSLQDICRFKVRAILREIIDIEHPELKQPTPPWKRVKKKNLHTLVIPIFNTNSDDEDRQSSREPASADDGQQFLMDVSSVNTCRSIVEWSQILQGTSAELLGAIDARCPHNGSSAMNPPVDIQNRDESMEEDSHFVIPSEDASEGNIFEDMSDEEFLSDVEELQSILRKAEDSASIFTSVKNADENVDEKTAELDVRVGETKTESKSKREKMDSGIVEDIETERDINLNAENEDNEETYSWNQDLYESLENHSPSRDNSVPEVEQENPKDSATKSAPPEDSTLFQVVNYTTCMKEKIQLLPLPMTLKYFLNLNREF